MASHRKTDLHLHGAFDTVRFGASNILNLRESLPTVADATHRAEAWIRQRQVEGVAEVLVITGRGKGSDGGVSPVRDGIIRLIASLRRRGVLDRFAEHTAGSFSITLAPIQSMIDAPRRRREPRRRFAPTGSGLSELTGPTLKVLRELAERSLDALGVKQTAPFLDAEMARQLAALRDALLAGEDFDIRLRSAIKQALDRTL